MAPRRRVVRRLASSAGAVPAEVMSRAEVEAQLGEMRKMRDTATRQQDNDLVDRVLTAWYARQRLSATDAEHDCETAGCARDGHIRLIHEGLSLYGCVKSGIYHRCIDNLVCNGGTAKGMAVGTRYAALHRSISTMVDRGTMCCLFSGRVVGRLMINSGDTNDIGFASVIRHDRRFIEEHRTERGSQTEWSVTPPSPTPKNKTKTKPITTPPPAVAMGTPTPSAPTTVTAVGGRRIVYETWVASMRERYPLETNGFVQRVRDVLRDLLLRREAREAASADALRRMLIQYHARCNAYVRDCRATRVAPSLVAVAAIYQTVRAQTSTLEPRPLIANAVIDEAAAVVGKLWQLLLAVAPHMMGNKPPSVRAFIIGAIYMMRRGVGMNDNLARVRVGGFNAETQREMGRRASSSSSSSAGGQLVARLQRNDMSLLPHAAASTADTAVVQVIPRIDALTAHLPKMGDLRHFPGGFSSTSVTEGSNVIRTMLKTAPWPPRVCADIVQRGTPIPDNY